MDGGDMSEAAQVARRRLHEEIERVRIGVEEMLDAEPESVRRELETLRLETRDYVKRRVRKAEKKMKRSLREMDARADRIEKRIDQVEADRQAAEVRIHTGTEQMLDGLLQDVRTIADRLASAPARGVG
jgi:hypothetical protein